MAMSRHPGPIGRGRFGALLVASFVLLLGLAATPALAVAGGPFTISGRALNESADALPGIRVAFCTSATSCGPTTTTAADGSYTSPLLSTGQYRVRFNDPANIYAAGYSTPLNTTDSWSAARAITVGPNRTGINGNMLPGTGIYGVITGPTGHAVAGASIVACGDPGQLCGTGRSASNGRYRVLVGEGRFTVRVTATVVGEAFDGYIGAFGLTFSRSTAVRLLAQPGMVHGASVQLTRAPRASFVTGSRLSSAGASATIRTRIAWATTSSAATIYQLRERVDAAAARLVSTVRASTFPGSVTQALAVGHGYQFDVRSVTGGVAGARHAGPASDLLLYQETSSQVTYSGTWATVTSADRSGGHARASASMGATATFTFTGRSVAWVTRTGPTAGMAQVYVDGQFAGTFDLSASAAATRTIAWTRTWPTAGSHQVVISEAGIGTHPPVEVDAFLVMD